MPKILADFPYLMEEDIHACLSFAAYRAPHSDRQLMRRVSLADEVGAHRRQAWVGASTLLLRPLLRRRDPTAPTD